MVDANGLLLALCVTPANVQDGHGAGPLLSQAKARHPSLARIVGDQLYGGPIVARAMAEISPHWHFLRVRRPKDQPRFTPIPKRWLVERTFAWISRQRRLDRDYERTTRSSLAFALLAMTRLMLRRLAKPATEITA